MATSFPELSPTARQFTAPEWATNFMDSQAGTTTRRLWGSRPSRAQLTLTFSNIGDTAVASIMQCHNDAKGACDEIRLTNATMGNAGGICDNSLSDLIQLADGDHRWHFVERGAVDVKSVALGLSTVTCKFRSEIPG